MYKYGDSAIIKSGFYKDCVGILIDFEQGYGAEKNRYTIEIEIVDCRNCGRIKEIKVTKEELEILKEHKK